MKEIKCRDVGKNCDFVCKGNTEEEVLKRVTEHARKAHGMADLSQEMKAKIRSLIKDSKAA